MKKINIAEKNCNPYEPLDKRLINEEEERERIRREEIPKSGMWQKIKRYFLYKEFRTVCCVDDEEYDIEST